MNLDRFTFRYRLFKDAEKIEITCDHPSHKPSGEIITIGKQPARRNIMKNDGEAFICRKCVMLHDNPALKSGQGRRQTDEIIRVRCPDPRHQGDPWREMKKRMYFGKLKKPHEQTCGSCAQLGKNISAEQRDAIRAKLTGITRSEEFKQKLRHYMTNNTEGIERARSNLVPGAGGGWNKGMATPAEVRMKISEAHVGKSFTEEHCRHISDGRKLMFARRRLLCLLSRGQQIVSERDCKEGDRDDNNDASAPIRGNHE